MKQATAQEVQMLTDYLQTGRRAEEADFREIIALLHKYKTLHTTMAKAQEYVHPGQTTLHGFTDSPALSTLPDPGRLRHRTGCLVAVAG